MCSCNLLPASKHCNENLIYVFLYWELRGLNPNFIHVSVSDLYIPRIGLPIWLQPNRQTDPGNFGNNEAAQFHFWENINQNQTFLLDSHLPFICDVQYCTYMNHTLVSTQ